MANGLNKTAKEGVEWDPKRGFNVMNPNKDFLVNVYCRTITSAGIEEIKQVRVHDYGSPGKGYYFYMNILKNQNIINTSSQKNICMFLIFFNVVRSLDSATHCMLDM